MPTRILVINPNSSQSMTDEIAAFMTSDLQLGTQQPGLQLTFRTGPPTCPSSIDNITDSIRSAAEVLSTLESDSTVDPLSVYDGIVVACYSPHPLVPMLKESLPLELSMPVVGIFETSLYTALQLGRTFGIVTTGKSWEGILTDGVRAAGIAEGKCVGVCGTGLGVHDLSPLGSAIDQQAEAKAPQGAEPRQEPSSDTQLVKDGQAHVVDRLLEVSLFLVRERCAEVIILGCAGMAPYREVLQIAITEALSTSPPSARPSNAGRPYLNNRSVLVPVVDGVRAAIESVAGLARMHARTSRVGVYAPTKGSSFKSSYP